MRKHLTDSEYDRLKSYVIESNNILIELLIRTGARQSEVCALTRDSFNFTDNTINVVGLKGSESRCVPVSSEFMGRVRSVVESMDSTIGAALTTDNVKTQARLVRSAFSECMVHLFGFNHGFSAHSLRHTFALRLLKQFGNDILKVQRAMGHKNINSTIRYLQYVQMEQMTGDILSAVD